MRFKKLTPRKEKSHTAKQTTRPISPAALLALLSVLLACFGVAMIFNVSAIAAFNDFGDKYYYLKEQAKWLVVGLVVMMFFMRIDYKKLFPLALPLLIGSIGMLIAVFIPGIGISALGASRWLNLGFTTLQPTEFLKVALVIYLAAWFSYKERGRLLSFLLLLGIIIVPVVLQPDLGSAVVIVLLALTIYFVSGAPLWQFGMVVPFMVSSVLLLAISAPYRLERVKTFLNPESDPQGTSYHLRQILIALGSGGWFGVGLGQSRQKFAYLPEVTTDSIFAVISEEVGFLGASLMLLLFLVMLYQGIRIALVARDRFGRLVAMGIVVTLGFQMLINLGAMVSILPLTGIPLPFISYGGSNLIVSFAMIGILLSIARRN
ncbi:putative lipid II flippase FtsW [Candidatus Roizmanbacteria bacterium]|nr:putative lipid II flippase FtsW [Candidatus Roizmanbacteria bacterium]